MPVLDRERDQSAWTACDVPSQSSSEPGRSDRAVRILGDDLAEETLGPCLIIRELYEALDPPAQSVLLDGSVVTALAGEVVVSGTEQKLALRNHAFQDADGVNDRGDGDPGNCSFLACGDVVAVIVGDVLEVVASDQVPARGAVGGGFGVRTAAGPETLYLLSAHPGQVQTDDRGCCAQVPHQLRGLAEVHVLAPGLPVDLSGESLGNP
ncbi:hypothetical protein ACWGH3_25190 [Streptomyces sp. NPDC054884]|uniref:hypothetical protein n=1 Tax=Streptomyces sp. NBC_00104 TaxID=2903621 RepID=UPI00386D5327